MTLHFATFSRPGHAQLANLRRLIIRAHRKPFPAEAKQMGVDWRRGLPYKQDAL
jgi:hypothetical protein